jgi:hypothetical protein
MPTAATAALTASVTAIQAVRSRWWPSSAGPWRSRTALVPGADRRQPDHLCEGTRAVLVPRIPGWICLLALVGSLVMRL